MLHWRLLSSGVVLSGLISLLVCDYRLIGTDRPGLWLVPLVLACAALATGEMLAMFATDHYRPSTRPLAWSTYVGTLAIVAASCAPIAWQHYPTDCPLGKLGWPLVGIAFGLGLAFVGEMLRYREPGDVIIRVAMGVLVMAYVGVLAGFLVQLRLFRDNQWGMAALVSTIAVVKMSDTGAYFAGRFFGRRALAPRLSPKKTVAGAVGGVLAAIGASYLLLNVLTPRWFVSDALPVAIWRWTAYGVILACVAMIGDLAESLLKRDSGCKDSSRWLPGLGGVLDMLDSLLLAAPVSYLCWASGLVGG